MTDNKEVILQSRIEQLEAEKAELLEALIYCYRLIKTTGLSIPQVSAIIESVTGKSIEEVL